MENNLSLAKQIDLRQQTRDTQVLHFNLIFIFENENKTVEIFETSSCFFFFL